MKYKSKHQKQPTLSKFSLIEFFFFSFIQRLYNIPSFIPIKESFIYLGITIYKNIHKIARDNCNNILVKVKNDIQRWKNLKVSLQGRISTVKMNLLPRFNFFFSMLPLSPPPGYFKEINSIISKFIWNDKCPRIKLTTLQHPNSAGGLAVPNCELYYWSFQLKALHNWVDPQSTVSWRVIEADKVNQHPPYWESQLKMTN